MRCPVLVKACHMQSLSIGLVCRRQCSRRPVSARVCSLSRVCRTLILTLTLTLDVQTRGFAWVDDTTSYHTHRWGWASEHVGDVLELQVRSLSHLWHALPVVRVPPCHSYSWENQPQSHFHH